jgi:hypothetical protein
MPQPNRKGTRPYEHSIVRLVSILLADDYRQLIFGDRTLASIIVEVVYGFKIQDMNDEYIKAAVESMDALSESRVSGKFWVDFLPWLRYIPSWVPGTAAVRFGAYWRPKIEKMINKPFDAVMQGTVSSLYTINSR